MKKKAISLFLITALVTASFTTGVIASDKITAVTAYVNKSLAINVNGQKIEPKESDGSRIYPIVYNERTYVPARAVAEALGASVDYNDAGDGTIIINSSSSNAGRPTKDASSTNVPTSTQKPVQTPKPTQEPAPSASQASSNTGSITSPIPLNETYTWSSTYTSEYTTESYSATYSATVKSAKPISLDEIADLGFKRPEDNPDVDYVMVDLLWQVKDAKLITPGEIASYKYLSAFEPYIWGVKSPSGKYIIGGTDFGFDGCLRNTIEDATNFKKLTPGMSDSFSAQGKIILPVLKSEECYLTLRNDSIKDYDKSFIYLKLK